MANDVERLCSEEAIIQSGRLTGQLGAAKWIWGGADPRPINVFRLFRREFELNDLPRTAELWAFAEFRYKLYVNGEFVQTGPAACQPAHRLLDRHDVRKWLKPGRNCLAFVVHCPGIMTGQWTLVNPGLFISLVVNGTPLLVSDAVWQTQAGEAWRHPTQICGYGKGFHEWLDLARMPAGWTVAGFNAANWDLAVELPFFAYGAAKYLGENYMGYPTLQLHNPSGLVNAGVADGIITEEMRKNAGEYYTAVRNRWWRMMGKWTLKNNNVPLDDNEPLPDPIAERAHQESHAPAPAGMVITGSQGVFPIKINVPEKGHPFVNMDLGIVRSGFLRLEIESQIGGTVDLGWDDRMKDGRVQVSRATPNCDRVIVPPGKVLWDGFFERGLRYLQIILREFRGSVTIRQAGVIETLTPIRAAEPATFESADDLLNRIWRAAMETTRLYVNASAAVDPIRERVHWMHDDTMALRMAFYCFGEWRVWRRALELTAQSQAADGSFPGISPGHCEDFNMVVSSCYWAVQVAEYFRHTGDAAFAERILPQVARHIEYELRFADGGGLLYETPGRRYLCWADGEPRVPYQHGETWAKTGRKPWGDFFAPVTRGYNTIINAHWLWCLREAADLAGRLGAVELAEQWRVLFTTGQVAFERRFWEPDVGLYRDNVVFDRQDVPYAPTFSEPTLFFLMRAGLLEQGKGLACVERIMAPDFVCARTSGGFEGSAYSVFLLETGRVRKALAYYLDRWGEPIKAGATTSGEEFFKLGGNSDCHIQGATPARDFLEFIAGIRIKGPMWSEVSFAPPADGPDLKASVPTPQGPIRIEIRTLKKGQREFRYSVPAGCRAYRRGKEGDTPLAGSEGTFAL